MKLLIVTQKIDKKDPVLGFFHRWVEEFAKRVEKVSVICLEEGEYNFPSNVSVFSLGKEEGRTKLGYIFRFYKYIWELRPEYEVVFVHMNQEYVLLAGDAWRLMGKKVYLWRNHVKGNFLTIMAIWLSHKVFYTSSQSFTAKFASPRRSLWRSAGKAVQMPAGIDTEFFKPDPVKKRVPGSILFLGRIAPVKRVLEFVDWLATQEFETATVVGQALPKDHAYHQRVKERVRELGLQSKVKFIGAVRHEETRDLYQTHELYVNLTPAGSLDKTILEAAACGTRVFVHNPELKILNTREDGVSFVKENHSLSKLVDLFLTHHT